MSIPDNMLSIFENHPSYCYLFGLGYYFHKKRIRLFIFVLWPVQHNSSSHNRVKILFVYKYFNVYCDYRFAT